MFTGFELKYPEYEVSTPQTKQSFTTRSLNVSEEERMKASFLSPQKITEHLNLVIFESFVKKPKHINDIQSFLKFTTTKDRDALLYALYHVSYEEIRNYDVTCTSCRKDYPITVKASDTFSMDIYPDDDILKKEVTVELPISKGVSAVIKQPTLLDEDYMYKRQSVQPGAKLDILSEVLAIQRFEQNIEAQVEPKVYTDRSDIVDAYMTLPPRDRRHISDSYTEHFGKYQMNLKMVSHCKFCGNEDVMNIDLVENFFRMVHGF